MKQGPKQEEGQEQSGYRRPAADEMRLMDDAAPPRRRTARPKRVDVKPMIPLMRQEVQRLETQVGVSEAELEQLAKLKGSFEDAIARTGVTRGSSDGDAGASEAERQTAEDQEKKKKKRGVLGMFTRVFRGEQGD